MTIYYKTEEEIELIRESCLIVSNALTVVAENIKPGISSLAIDKLAETYIRDQNAVPGFKGYNGFPATLCISINEQVVHGIPTEYVFKDGDIVSVDCGAYKNGFYGDSAYSFGLGEISEDYKRLLQVTNDSLYAGIDAAQPGNRIGDIGFAIQELVEVENGFSIVRDLVGHGIGKNLHEPPEVPNYGRKGKGIVLKEGLVIAIEPMVNFGKKDVKQHSDGWTIVTRDNLPSAHFEHTIVIRKTGPEILSNHVIIEEAVKNNKNIEQMSIKSSIFAPRN